MRESKRSKNCHLTAVVPVYNESKLAAEFLKALAEQLQALVTSFDIVMIDDGSKDDTVEQVKAVIDQLPVELIVFSRNFGKEKAITAGLQHAQGDVVLIIDADFQHPFETIQELFEKWCEGYDNVYAVRNNRSDQTALNRFFANRFYKLNQHLMNIDLPPDAGDFRLLDRKVVDAINCLPEANRFMKGLYAWVGFKGCAVTYKVLPRKEGVSRFRFRRLFGLALTGITSFSDVPLRIWTGMGVLISLFSLLYGLYILISTLVEGVSVPGWATLTVGLMFLGGIQLLSIGIIGEYVGRIFTEVKRRPNYLIAERHLSSKPPTSLNK